MSGYQMVVRFPDSGKNGPSDIQTCPVFKWLKKMATIAIQKLDELGRIFRSWPENPPLNFRTHFHDLKSGLIQFSAGQCSSVLSVASCIATVQVFAVLPVVFVESIFKTLVKALVNQILADFVFTCSTCLVRDPPRFMVPEPTRLV
jgi:hypothetical protein